MYEWQEIGSFPGYSVSEIGTIRNDNTDRIMALTVNQRGVVNVGLVRNGIQYKRAVSILVAKAFLPPARNELFDSAINLDGDRTNNHVENLLWRPRWFATKYFQQFRCTPNLRPLRVEEINTRQKFETTWLAAITYGLLDLDVRRSAVEEGEVWPTYQRFRMI